MAKRRTGRYARFGARAYVKAWEDSGYGRVHSRPRGGLKVQGVLARTRPGADVTAARPGPAQSVTGLTRGELCPGSDVGRGEPSPGADVGRVSPVLAQMWQR